MSKHMVTCVQCGRQFDANKGGYYNRDTRRYTCKSCGKRIKHSGSPNGKTWFGDNWQYVIGGLFLFSAIYSIGGTEYPMSTILIEFLIGLGLLAWKIVPKIMNKKKEEQVVKEEIKIEYNKLKTCPYCGAETKGNVCEYCGKSLN